MRRLICWQIVTLLVCWPSLLLGHTTVVEIINLGCQTSYQVAQQLAPLSARLVSIGGYLDVVPVVYGQASPWPALVYLSLPPRYRQVGAQALFQAQVVDGLTLRTVSATCVVVNRALPDYTVAECQRQAGSAYPRVRLQHVMQLLHHLYQDPKAVVRFPLFIIEKDHRVQSIVGRGLYPSVDELIHEVIRRV